MEKLLNNGKLDGYVVCVCVVKGSLCFLGKIYYL